jgi:hypothetical protein
MRASILLLATPLLAFASLAASGCSAANPLNGIGGQAPDAGQAASSTNDNAGNGDNGDDGDDGNGTSSSGGSTPSPLHFPDASAPTGDDAGTSDDGGATSTEDGSTTVAASDGGASAAVLAHCVAALNSYRTQASVSALTESSALESYAAAASASDAQSGQTHGYYAGNDGNGVSSAESELPGWPLDQYASVDDMIDQGVAAIFQQGPGAAPYDNLVNASFKQAGCGVAQTPDGNVWVAIEYH